MIRPIAYVAGPYTSDDPLEVAANIELADRAGRELARKGYAVIVPHNLTRGWDDDFSHEDILALDLALLGRCDLLVCVGAWQRSPGAVQEHSFASERAIPIAYSLDTVPLPFDLLNASPTRVVRALVTSLQTRPS